MPDRVAVIDIGSNTIKLLVAEIEVLSGNLKSLYENTLETRIGQGISAREPALTGEAIVRASDAVLLLVQEAQPFTPSTIRVVGTSAARDATNSSDLSRAISEKTGIELEILSGRREAELIGAAIQLDPNITANDFYVFDLGGGSLECLRFSDRTLDQIVSLPLGCVRLAEKLLADRAAVFTSADERAVAAEIRTVIQKNGFAFSLPPGSICVGTGGTLTVALNIIAGQQNRPMSELKPFLSQDELRHLLAMVGGCPLPDRLRIPRLTAGRADVLPTALATFLTLADLAQQDGIHHSHFNLRYGLAAEMLKR